ncbi:MAG: transposase [Bryobacteraceae bacterium]|nr:transposase [Bryobacteraceae bacterium]
MPRVARIVIPGLPHHITQRGNYRQKIFFRSEDYRLYLNLLAEYARHYGVAILGYCLMPNHVHLILVPRNEQALGRLFRRLHGDYARAIHVRLRRKGHLFQARFQSVPMDEEHFRAAMVYVEQNPQRARLGTGALAERPSGPGAVAATVHARELGLADAAMLQRIREATALGLPLGREEWLQRIEEDFSD